MLTANELAQRIFYACYDRVGAARRRLFTFAESCTGGLVAGAVTGCAGISAYFPGSLVVYSDEAKIEQLAVAPETILQYGAVSGQCAAEMAYGAAARMGTDFSVAITGVAGPSGGTDDCPVGTVWFAVYDRSCGLRLRRGFYPGRSRRDTQQRAVISALELLLRALKSRNEEETIYG